MSDENERRTFVCHDLIHSDALDKETSLKVIELFYNMELAHQNELHECKRQLVCLKHELEMSQLIVQHTESIDALTCDSAAFKTHIRNIFTRLDAIEKQFVASKRR